VLLAALGLAACADPQTRFDEFSTRYTELNPPVISELCVDNPCAQPATAGSIDGSYLWTIATELYPPNPVVLHAVLTTVARTVRAQSSQPQAPISTVARSL
jgi:hypothetical protein